MKFIVTTFDKGNNGRVMEGWFKHSIPEIRKHSLVENYSASEIEACDAIILFRNWRDTFVFDEGLFDACKNKPFIVIDYAEYGPASMYDEEYLTAWDIIGVRIDPLFESACTEEHKKLTNRFLDCSIKAYFKRELSHAVYNKRQDLNLYPLDYFANNMPDAILLTEEEFYSRPLDLLFNWGFSNPERCKLHGRIMMEIEKFGHNVFLSMAQFEESIRNKSDHSFLLIRSDHHERVDYSMLQQQSRLVLDLFGNGMKCFRNWESALHSISVKQDPSLLVRTFAWTDGRDCLILPTNVNRLNLDDAIDVIYEYTRGGKRHELYPIYKNSIQHARKYESKYYFDNHIYPALDEALLESKPDIS